MAVAQSGSSSAGSWPGLQWSQQNSVHGRCLVCRVCSVALMAWAQVGNQATSAAPVLTYSVGSTRAGGSMWQISSQISLGTESGVCTSVGHVVLDLV